MLPMRKKLEVFIKNKLFIENIGVIQLEAICFGKQHEVKIILTFELESAVFTSSLCTLTVICS